MVLIRESHPPRAVRRNPYLPKLKLKSCRWLVAACGNGLLARGEWWCGFNPSPGQGSPPLIAIELSTTAERYSPSAKDV
jgi:hypothetical protein